LDVDIVLWRRFKKLNERDKVDFLFVANEQELFYFDDQLYYIDVVSVVNRLLYGMIFQTEQ